MKLNKKASSEMWAPDTILFWIIYGIALAFVALFFVLTISKIGSEQAKINGNIESLNLMQRLFKSPDCFAYNKDDILKIRVIDADKFNEEKLNSCYKITDNTVSAFRLTLASYTTNIHNIIQTKNWNDNREFEEKKTPKDVLVYSQGKLYNGEITIEIQNLQ